MIVLLSQVSDHLLITRLAIIAFLICTLQKFVNLTITKVVFILIICVLLDLIHWLLNILNLFQGLLNFSLLLSFIN